MQNIQSYCPPYAKRVRAEFRGNEDNPEIKEYLHSCFDNQTAEAAYQQIRSFSKFWDANQLPIFHRFKSTSFFGMFVDRKEDRLVYYLVTSQLLGKGDVKKVYRGIGLPEGRKLAVGINYKSNLWKALNNECSFLERLKGNKRFCQKVANYRFSPKKNRKCVALIMKNYSGYFDLDHLILENRLSSFNDKVLIVRQIFEAVNEMFLQGISNHDLKVDNIRVKKRENGWKVVILDFSHAVSVEKHTTRGAIGSLPPELFRMHCPIKDSVGVDVWSACTIIYEIFKGEAWGEAAFPKPFSTKKYTSKMSILEELPGKQSIPPIIYPLLMKVMKVDPVKRPNPEVALKEYLAWEKQTVWEIPESLRMG